MADCAHHPKKTLPSLDGYTVGETVGTGSYGSVYIGWEDGTDEEVAIKEVMKSRLDSIDELRREAFVMAKLKNHRYVCQLKKYQETHDRIFIVMEYAANGDLLEEVLGNGEPNGGLPEIEACRVFVQVLLAVESIHNSGIVHYDLKPENVFLDEHMNIKLGDFGLSASFSTDRRQRARGGTLEYAAPESLLGIDVVGPEVDVWGLGVTLYVMLTGHYPFWGKTQRMVGTAILTKDSPCPPTLSRAVRDLLDHMFIKDPDHRITIPDVKQHPWIRRELTRQMRRQTREVMLKEGSCGGSHSLRETWLALAHTAKRVEQMQRQMVAKAAARVEADARQKFAQLDKAYTPVHHSSSDNDELSRGSSFEPCGLDVDEPLPPPHVTTRTHSHSVGAAPSPAFALVTVARPESAPPVRMPEIRVTGDRFERSPSPVAGIAIRSSTQPSRTEASALLPSSPARHSRSRSRTRGFAPSSASSPGRSKSASRSHSRSKSRSRSRKGAHSGAKRGTSSSSPIEKRAAMDSYVEQVLQLSPRADTSSPTEFVPATHTVAGVLGIIRPSPSPDTPDVSSSSRLVHITQRTTPPHDPNSVEAKPSSSPSLPLSTATSNTVTAQTTSPPTASPTTSPPPSTTTSPPSTTSATSPTTPTNTKPTQLVQTSTIPEDISTPTIPITTTTAPEPVEHDTTPQPQSALSSSLASAKLMRYSKLSASLQNLKAHTPPKRLTPPSSQSSSQSPSPPLASHTQSSGIAVRPSVRRTASGHAVSHSLESTSLMLRGNAGKPRPASERDLLSLREPTPPTSRTEASRHKLTVLDHDTEEFPDSPQRLPDVSSSSKGVQRSNSTPSTLGTRRISRKRSPGCGTDATYETNRRSRSPKGELA